MVSSAGYRAQVERNPTIAREYGLPAVVRVENAIKRIMDGERTQVNETARDMMIIS
ncbi:MAG: hypothetical protein WBI17_09320 [Clostridiaceae bacterium]